MGHSHSQAWVRLGHYYQSNSSMAGDPISHSMTWVAGTRPLPIPRASAHSIRAAAAIVLGRRGRLRWRPATSERPALGRSPQSPWPPLTVLFLLLSSTTTRGKGGPGAIPGARRVVSGLSALLSTNMLGYEGLTWEQGSRSLQVWIPSPL